MATMGFKMGLSWDLAWFSHHWCIPSIFANAVRSQASLCLVLCTSLSSVTVGLVRRPKSWLEPEKDMGLKMFEALTIHIRYYELMYIYDNIILYDIVIRRFQGISGFEAVWTCSKRTYVILSQWESYWFNFCRWHRNPDVGQTSDPEREITGAIIDNSLVAGLEHFSFFHILWIKIPTDFPIFQDG